MKLLFWTLASKETGFGHFYRTRTLANEAEKQGHSVVFACNYLDTITLSSRELKTGSKKEYQNIVARFDPDWLVIDLPGDPPKWMTQQKTTKTCLLNGVGHQSEVDADLTIIQGVVDTDRKDTVSGIEYIILRPELANMERRVSTNRHFVWGGAADKMGLRQRMIVSRIPCYLMSVNDVTEPITRGLNIAQKVIWSEGDDFLMMACKCLKAVSAMGMAVYELLYLGIPTVVFSVSEQHLEFAMPLAREGMATVYDHVGLPEDKGEFNFMIRTARPPLRGVLDLQGANRIINLLAERGTNGTTTNR